MKRAIDIFTWVAVFGFLGSMMSCGMGWQLHWNSPEVAGVYICGASLLSALIAAVLIGIGWVRKNVRIQ